MILQPASGALARCSANAGNVDSNADECRADLAAKRVYALQAGLPGLSSLQELNLQHCGQLTREGLGFAAPLPALTALK